MSYLNRNNAMHYCRTCLADLEKSRVDEVHHLKEIEHLAKSLKNFLGIHYLNEYPQFICGECYRVLKKFDAFKLLVRHSNEVLDTLLGNPQTKPSESNLDVLSKYNTVELQTKRIGEVEVKIEEEFISIKDEPGVQPVDETLEIIKTNSKGTSSLRPEISGVTKPKTTNNTEKQMNLHQCGICRKFFKHKNRLKSHMLFSHKSRRPCICKYCHKCFISSSVLKAHELIHAGEEPYFCDLCYRPFRYKYSMKRHRLRIHGSKSSKAVCSSSKTVLKKMENKAQYNDLNKISTPETQLKLSDEIETKIELETSETLSTSNSSSTNNIEEAKLHQCCVCGILVRSSNCLYAPILCSFCHKCFFGNEVLTMHEPIHTNEEPYQQRMHNSNSLKNKCTTSETMLKESQSKIPKNIEQHKDLDEIPTSNVQLEPSDEVEIKAELETLDSFSPEICDVRKSSSSNNVEKQKTLHKCGNCTKLFKKKFNLKAHQVLHTGEKPYPCEICGRRFAQPSTLRKHRDRKRGCKSAKDYSSLKSKDLDEISTPNAQLEPIGEIEKTSETSSYVPTIGGVGKCTSAKNVLKQKTLHKCGNCSKTFKKKYNLKQHQVVHTGEEPYSCDICDRHFRHSSSMRKHRKKHNSNSAGKGVFKKTLDVAAETFRTRI